MFCQKRRNPYGNCQRARALLAAEGFDFGRIAVERNGDIVPKGLYGQTILRDGDTLEVVRFVGGG